MAIAVTCESCGKAMKARDAAAGKRFKCPVCGTVLRVPGEALVVPVREVVPLADGTAPIGPGLVVAFRVLVVLAVLSFAGLVLWPRSPNAARDKLNLAIDEQARKERTAEKYRAALLRFAGPARLPPKGSEILTLQRRANDKMVPGSGGERWLRSLTGLERWGVVLNQVTAGVSREEAGRVVRMGYGRYLPATIRLLRNELGGPAAEAVADGYERLLPFVDLTHWPFEGRVWRDVEGDRAALIEELDAEFQAWGEELDEDVDRWLRRVWNDDVPGPEEPLFGPDDDSESRGASSYQARPWQSHATVSRYRPGVGTSASPSMRCGTVNGKT